MYLAKRNRVTTGQLIFARNHHKAVFCFVYAQCGRTRHAAGADSN